MRLDLSKIRAAVKSDHTEWRRHALLRATERGITLEQALQVILEGDIIEDYPQAKPYPACLMMAMAKPGKPLYVSLAYDEENDLLHIITVHWLDPCKWEDPWTRKPPGPKLE